MGDPEALEQHDPRVLRLKAVLLLAWAGVTFGVAWFARDLEFALGAWPFSYWVAAQGALLAFVAIVVVYAWAMRRLVPQDAEETGGADG